MTSNLSNRIIAGLLLTGTSIVVGTALGHWMRQDAPVYGMAIPVNPIILSHDDPHSDPAARQRTVPLTVVNTGRTAFRIASVETSCSCTMAEKLTGESVPPGGTLEIPLRIDLPSHGKKQTFLTITTDRAEIPPSVVKIQMSGPDYPVPMIQSASPPFQLTAHSHGEKVTQAFQVSTVEKLGEEPWITGMVATHPTAEVKLLSVEQTSKNELLQFQNRLYHFEISFSGPQDEHEVVHCSVKEQTRSAAVKPSDMPTFRCTLSPELQAQVD